MISRGMIFNSLSIIYGIYKFSKKIGKFLKIQSISKTLDFAASCSSDNSVILVNEIRANIFTGKS